MKLNPTKGNMYEFVTHTANAIKGKCPHDCSYCYVKRFGKLRDVRLDEKELTIPMSEGNFIFVGSGCDMFADDIPAAWIQRTLDHCREYENRYLFQSKNPRGMTNMLYDLDAVACTTIETNRWYPSIMNNSPTPALRAYDMANLSHEKYVTIEPIMDFDLPDLVNLIKMCNPVQVNIGADSGGNHLPEPSKDKVMELITALNEFTVVSQKRNLGRLL
jgi:DNA repair photolyase